MDDSLLGPASRFARRELGGIFQPGGVAVPVDAASIEVVPYNPNRIGLLITNTGTTNITLRRESPVVSGVGILLLGNGATLSLNYKDDGDAVCFQFYGIGDAAGGSLYVESILQAFKEAAKV